MMQRDGGGEGVLMPLGGPPWCGNSNQAHHATEKGRAQVFEKPKHPGDRLMWRRAALHHVLGQNTDRRRTEECGTGGARTSIQSVSRTQWSSRYSSSLPASHRPAGNSSRPGGRATGPTSGAAVRRRLCVLTRTEPALDKLKFDLTADCARCASECFESHGMAVRGTDAVKRAPARLHPAGHLRLGETLLLHGLLNLPGENPLNGKALGRFVGPLVLQKVIKGGANAGLLRCALLHCSISFMRLRARVRSSFGIFFVFFTNPCSRTIRPCAMQKITRAMRCHEACCGPPRGPARAAGTPASRRAIRTQRWRCPRRSRGDPRTTGL